MNFLHHVARSLARIRSSYRVNPVDPSRDWVTVLAVSIIVCAGFLAASFSLFGAARTGALPPAAGESGGVETIDRALLTKTIAAFREREAATQKLFASPPAFADPSR